MSFPQTTTKDRLFIAAIGCFARHGYKEATVRDICAAAGAANANAVSYHFGGKKKLYQAILDVIFAENLRRRKEAEASQEQDLSPEQRLRGFLATMIDVGFSGEAVAKDATAIVLREMMSPSRHLDRLVESCVLSDVADFTAILKDLLGHDAPNHVVRDCMASVGGQIYYYLAFWPIFSRVHPEHPGIMAYKEPLLDHLMRFSLAGLEATRKALENGDIPGDMPAASQP